MTWPGGVPPIAAPPGHPTHSDVLEKTSVEPRVFTTLMRSLDTAPGTRLGTVRAAVTDPRTLPVTALAYTGRSWDNLVLLEDLLYGNGRVELLRVEPVGPVFEVPGGPPYRYTAPAWTVTAAAPATDVLGPQATDVVAAMERLVQLRCDADLADAAARYHKVLDLYRVEMDTALECAADALASVGADRDWWAGGAFPGTYGHEIAAIAARDLIGTVPGWTTEAHDILTSPYRAAFDDVPGHTRPEGE